ncbi:MAG: hypothetical protein AB7K09_19765 [Planctomycetota bacterium]
MYLFNAIPVRHEALISASLRREDRAGIPGPIDTRVEPLGQHWQPAVEALVTMRDTLAATGRPPDLHVIACSYSQHGAPTECRVTIGMGRAVHVREVTFSTIVRLRLGAPVALAGPVGPAGLPTFAAPDAPLVARQLNQALGLRRTLATLMRESYRIGSELVQIVPRFRLAPPDESANLAGRARTTSGSLMATVVDASLRVTTTLLAGFPRYTFGAREFGLLRKQLVEATADSAVAAVVNS